MKTYHNDISFGHMAAQLIPLVDEKIEDLMRLADNLRRLNGEPARYEQPAGPPGGGSAGGGVDPVLSGPGPRVSPVPHPEPLPEGEGRINTETERGQRGRGRRKGGVSALVEEFALNCREEFSIKDAVNFVRARKPDLSEQQLAGVRARLSELQGRGLIENLGRGADGVSRFRTAPGSRKAAERARAVEAGKRKAPTRPRSAGRRSSGVSAMIREYARGMTSFTVPHLKEHLRSSGVDVDKHDVVWPPLRSLERRGMVKRAERSAADGSVIFERIGDWWREGKNDTTLKYEEFRRGITTHANGGGE